MPETRVLQADHGEVYTAGLMWLHLQQCLEMAGEDTTGLSPHNFCIGSVSEAEGKGASEAQLQMVGHWKSNPYMKYV